MLKSHLFMTRNGLLGEREKRNLSPTTGDEPRGLTASPLR